MHWNFYIFKVFLRQFDILHKYDSLFFYIIEAHQTINRFILSFWEAHQGFFFSFIIK